MYNAGLVLEGGGMKGVYTAGVLDFFLDKELEFENVYGVSAGACTMCSYLSKQKGRGRDTMTDYLNDKHYMGLFSMATTGDIFGVDMNYDLVPNYLNPYDYETFNKYKGNAYAVVTNIETGEAEYAKLTDMHEGIQYVRASSSLPLVSRNVKIGNNLYLDGGIADPIPIKKSIEDGNVKNIVVMTKPVGFRRQPEGMLKAIKLKYHKYPKVYELMANRHITYNETMDYIEAEAKKGSIILIRPKVDTHIARMEKDKDKLLALYEEGYNEAKEQYENIIEYLNK